MIKKLLPPLFLVVGLAQIVYSQEIQTAQSFFAKVSAKFGSIRDYSCDFEIRQGDQVSTGKLYYKTPNLLRLDYDEPKGQVLLADGKKLQIYIPSTGIILEHSFKQKSKSSLRNMVDIKALYLLSEGYDIAYLKSPDPVPLNSPDTDEKSAGEGTSTQPSASQGEGEMVVKLKLTRSNSLEMFREIVLSIGSDHLIRRFRGIKEDYSEIVMDFVHPKIDQDIPDTTFQEEAWPEANVYADFLTMPE